MKIDVPELMAGPSRWTVFSDQRQCCQHLAITRLGPVPARGFAAA
jgi:hypothetical protein